MRSSVVNHWINGRQWGELANPVEPFRSYVVRYLTQPEELKVQLHSPVLLFEPVGPPDVEDSTSGEYRLRTSSGAGPGTRLSPEEPVVMLVKKSKDNAFQRGVTVGRTGNNDIVLDDPSVSRFHAWFQRDDSDVWTLSDAGSKNGTILSGTRLLGKRPVVVPPQCAVQFGDVALTLFSVERFFLFLEARARA